jgi:hypothetical protein
MTRNDLKDLIKECILEVITEGVRSERGTAMAAPVRESRQNRMPAASPAPQRKMIGGTVLDRPALPTRSQPAPAPAPARMVQTLTADPTLQSIFADTAATTLQEQISAERGGPVLAGGDAAAHFASKSDPTDLFGAAAANWAALAFADEVKK